MAVSIVDPHKGVVDSTGETKKVVAAIALGSNLGDQFRNIELALRYLENPHLLDISDDDTPSGQKNEGAPVTITNTSFLYETAPMYVLDQPKFVNGACLVETTLAPFPLLNLLKRIEAKVGRVPSIRNGPRAIDLDVLIYDVDNEGVIDTRVGKADKDVELGTVKEGEVLEGELVIPHPRMQEREFVLRPLNDILPTYNHPLLKKPIYSLLAGLLSSGSAEPSMVKVIPFPNILPNWSPQNILDVPWTLSCWRFGISGAKSGQKPRTKVMAIINVTPDSFSDGHSSIPGVSAQGTDVSLVHSARSASAALEDGADILDIGGYSTRPGADFVTVEDEIGRVVPVIQSIRSSSLQSENTAPISIDTFRPSVALAALRAGANLVNDVYALSGSVALQDPYSFPTPDSHEMRDILKKYNAPVIMMHSRGEAGSNKDYSSYVTSAGHEGIPAVVSGIREELGKKVKWAIEGQGGLRRWQVLVDAGVGFSKTVEGNVDILKSLDRISENGLDYAGTGHLMTDVYRNPLAGFPQLLGHSRKSFLGKITQLSYPLDASKLNVADADQKNASAKKRSARELDCASAVVTGLAVQKGVEIVRVHDVKGAVDALKVASALYL